MEKLIYLIAGISIARFALDIHRWFKRMEFEANLETAIQSQIERDRQNYEKSLCFTNKELDELDRRVGDYLG